MTDSLPTAYPLQWPIGRPRTASPEHTWAFRVQRTRDRHSVASSVHYILSELRKMEAVDVVVSTNLRVRLDGLPYSDQRAPADPGVAVYFHRDGKPIAFACDKWTTVEDNLRAVFKTLEALRGIDRWGAATLSATFTGYVAIAAPAGSMWYEVLGVSVRATAPEIAAAYRARAKALHPDVPGGSHESFVRLQAALQTAVEMGLVTT